MQHSTIPQYLFQSAQEGPVVLPEPEPEPSAAWQEHLSLLGLPRGGLEAFRTLNESWLYQKSNWPPGVEKWLHRYMHTTDLYEVTKSEAPEFSKLVDLFIAASSLPRTIAARQILAAKCQSFVNETSKAWAKEGVIEGKFCAWRKRAQFQALWGAETANLKRHKVVLEQTPSELDFGDPLEMSRRSATSNSRGLSEDSIPAKRTAEEERSSIESSKRARRSSSRFVEDEAGDFIIVSPANRRTRAPFDVQIEEENALSPSTYDDPKSPIEKIHPDCEVSAEGAQKAMDVWNSLQSSALAPKIGLPQTSESEFSRGKDSSSLSTSERSSSVEEITCRRVSPASKRGSVGSLAPGSEWSSVHGSEHARTAAVRTPGSETQADPNPISRRSTPQAQVDAHHQYSTISPSIGQQRTPLPSQREQSPSQIPATASRPTTHQSPEMPLQSPPISGQPRDPAGRPRTGEAQVSGIRDTSVETRLNSWTVSSQESQNQKSRWAYEDRVPGPQSPRIDHPRNFNCSPVTSTISSSSMPSSGPGPFTTFPSTFSVLTTESVQQKNQAKTGKMRGRKPAIHDDEQPISNATIVPDQAAEISPSLFQQDGLPREAPSTSQTKQAGLPAQSGLPAIPVSHGFYQTQLPPRPTITPPPGPTSLPLETPRPRSIEFTINNEAQSDLSPNDFQSLVDKFKRNARAIITGINSPNCVYEIDVIMFETLPWFYKWYSDKTGFINIGALRFELIDVHWQQENSIVVPQGNLHFFRALKQYIWDLYWVAMDMNKVRDQFRVTISPYPPRVEDGAANARGWKAVNPSKAAAKLASPPSSQRILVVPTGVPTRFQTQARPSPPSHAGSFSLPPPPPPPTTTHQVSHSEPQASVYHGSQRSPSLSESLSSLNELAYRHSLHSRGLRPPSRQNDTDFRSVDAAPQQSQSLYSPVEQRRSSWDQTLLRDYASSLKMPNAELMHEESTVKDKLPYKNGSEVCAVVIDRMSGKGQVTVSGKGYVTLNIPTGPDETGDRFKQIIIHPKQTCMLHGGAVALYFKRAFTPPPPPRPSIPGAEANNRFTNDVQAHSLSYNQGTCVTAFRDDRPPPPPPLSQHSQCQQILQRQESQSSCSSSSLDIKIRVQVDGTGKFSIPFGKSVLRPKVTTTEFFSWFTSQGRQAPPQPPRHLKFTFKDAMPNPQATEIVVGNEDHFNYMRKDIKVQCEKARKFMPELKEFVILVTVPGWTSAEVEEEDDW
ncbi:hypothetical protein ONS95_000203 [Cadophora gregata]|uniref:uncharacterized protein n=1 Tax=Cadophora gregata TaxID=51156 RepID=UPI0026DDAB67|nr:uncharacterized protein ONS95_000203 [Cadophora gregata]KAK0115519.1 hypothetical protein ONS96_013972 [Cadophora gregata f. sp. sojae]KAK0128225.1 hypothetical protein ONS95_000203 [Cadophora gregata]